MYIKAYICDHCGNVFDEENFNADEVFRITVSKVEASNEKKDLFHLCKACRDKIVLDFMKNKTEVTICAEEISDK